MKKKILLLLSLISLVSSCSTKESSKPSSSLQEEEFTLNGETILNTLTGLKENCNYQLDYSINSQNYTEIYTEDYVYFKTQGTGAIRLKNVSYQDNNSKALYNFNVENDTVNITSATYDSNGSYYSTSEVNSFTMLNYNEQYRVKNDDFVKSNVADSLYTSNKTIEKIFANLLNYSTLQANGTFSGVLITMKDYDSFTFTLMTLSSDDGETLVPYTDGSGTISNISKAKDPLLEEYLKDNNYALGEALKEGEASNILAGNLHFESSIKQLSGSQASLQSKIVVDYNSTQLKVNQYNSSNTLTSDYYYERGENDEINQPQLDATNTVNKNTFGSGYTWLNGLYFPYQVFHSTEFRKVGERTYRYFGIDLGNLLLAFFRNSSSYTFQYLDVLTSKAGTIDSIEAYTSPVASGTDSSGNTTYTQYKYEVGNFREASSIAKVTELTGIKEVSDTLGEALKKLSSTSDNIKIHLSDDVSTSMNGYTDFYFTKDFVFKEAKAMESSSNNYNKKDIIYQGYYDTKDGLANFYYDYSKDKLISKGIDKNDTISSHWLDKVLKLSSDVFEIDTSDTSLKTFKLRDEVSIVKTSFIDLIGLADSGQIYKDTIRITIDSDNNISSIKYTFKGMVDRKAMMEFTYGDKVVIPEEVKDKVTSNTSWKSYTSWKDEGIYDLLHQILKEEADEVPYLFSEDLAGSYHIIASGEKSVTIYNDYKDTNFFNTYKRYLTSHGYSVKNDVYSKGKISITFGKDTKDGFVVSLND